MAPTLIRVESKRTAINWNLVMNKTLSARPAFGHDHFIYRTPRWLEATHRGLCLLIAGLLAYLALSTDSIALPLAVTLWLASGILVLTGLRGRTEDVSIHFVCDHEGIYFPSSRTLSIVARTNEVPWLHVPWSNISGIRIQLLLDETGNTKGIVFNVVATESEEREFLARHTMIRDPGVRKPGPTKSILVGFSSFFHRHDEVMSILRRFQTTAPSNGIVPIEENPPRIRDLAKRNWARDVAQ